MNVTSEKFMELLEQSLLVIKKPHFDIDVSLYFLPYVEPKVAARRLSARQGFLGKIKKEIVRLQHSKLNQEKPHISAILEHNLALVQAEINFLSHVVQTIKKRV